MNTSSVFSRLWNTSMFSNDRSLMAESQFRPLEDVTDRKWCHRHVVRPWFPIRLQQTWNHLRNISMFSTSHNGGVSVSVAKGRPTPKIMSPSCLATTVTYSCSLGMYSFILNLLWIKSMLSIGRNGGMLISAARKCQRNSITWPECLYMLRWKSSSISYRSKVILCFTFGWILIVTQNLIFWQI